MNRGVVLWRLVVLAAVAAAMAAVSACGSSSEGGGTTATASGGAIPKGPIVVGMPIGMSGFLVNFDGPFYEGAKVAVADVNRRGGVLGHQLKLVTSDTHSDINQGTRAAIDVMDHGAQVLLPSVDYDFGGGAARAAQKAGKVAISTAGSTRFGKAGIGDLFFNLFAGTPTEAAAGAEFAYGELRARHPYVLIDTSITHSKDYAAGFEWAWERLSGAGDLPSDTFENGDPSIATQINRLKSASPTPDVIVLASYPPGGAAAIRQLRAAGIDAPIVTNNAFDGEFWLPSVPQEDNTYVTTIGVPAPGADPDPARRAFFKSFAASTGKPAVSGNHALAGYAAIEALKDAITRAKSVDGEAVKAQLEAFKDEPLISGPTTWTPQCHVAVGSPFVVAKADNGRLVYETTIKPREVQPSPC